VVRCAWNVEIRRARAGNHLIYEGLALLAAGTALAGHPRAGHWGETGLRILKREMARQVRPDGMNGELCTSYHLITGTNFLKGWVLAQNRDAELSLQYQRSLNRMSAVAAQLRADDGGFIALGDSDRVVGVCREEKESRAFALLVGKDNNNLELDWLLAGQEPDFMKEAAGEASDNHHDFGGYHLRRGASGGLLIFDAGPFGMPGASHHGHADSLAFEVHLPGTRFLIDPGGFSYVDFAARAFARSTAAHNTVRVDNRDSSQISGDFDYGRSAQARCLGIYAMHGGYLFCGEHDGYTPLVHRRALLWIPGPPLRLIVFDKVVGSGSHFIEAFHHADAGWKARVEDGNRVVWQKDHHSVVQAAWFSQAGKVQLVQGQIEPQRQGWVSKSYGEYLEAPVLICQCSGDLPITIVNAFAEMSGDPQRISFDASGTELTISPSEKFRWCWDGDIPEISREIVDGHQVIQ
jgi:hypothetical protein